MTNSKIIIIIKKKLLLIGFCFFSLGNNTIAQSEKAIYTYDFMTIKEGQQKEAHFYINNNWKKLRKEAVKREIITSYQVHEIFDSSFSKWNVILITIYKNREQYKNREANFKPIMKDLLPNGPVFLNHKKKEEFLETNAWLDAQTFEP